MTYENMNSWIRISNLFSANHEINFIDLYLEFRAFKYTAIYRLVTST